MVWIGRTRYNTQLMTSEAQSFAEIERDSTQIERASRGKITAASLYVTFQRNANNATSRPEILVPPRPRLSTSCLARVAWSCQPLSVLSLCLSPPPPLSLSQLYIHISENSMLYVRRHCFMSFYSGFMSLFSAPLYPRTARRYRNRFYCYYYYYYFCLSACFAARDKIWSFDLRHRRPTTQRVTTAWQCVS